MNKLGISWEHNRNTLRTRKKQKIPLFHPPLPKEKNWAPHECMLSLLIDSMKLLFSKLFVTIFGLG